MNETQKVVMFLGNPDKRAEFVRPFEAANFSIIATPSVKEAYEYFVLFEVSLLVILYEATLDFKGMKRWGLKYPHIFFVHDPEKDPTPSMSRVTYLDVAQMSPEKLFSEALPYLK